MAAITLLLVRISVLAIGIVFSMAFIVCPVNASDTIPAGTVLEGTFNEPNEHWDGRYILKRGELTVTAILGSTRSPVRHHSLQQSSILFTVPEKFRPETPVTWNVVGWHMLPDGTPHPILVEPQNFTLRIEPSGLVRYVEDGRYEHIGYFRYEVRMAWPLSGANPEVCDRSESVQKAILASLGKTHVELETENPATGADPLCKDVTWSDLSAISNLGTGDEQALLEVARSTDLAGLTGLEVFGLRVVDESLPEDLLAQTPRLQALQVQTGVVNWLPADFLDPVSHLENLAVESDISLAKASIDQDLLLDMSSYAPRSAYFELIPGQGDLTKPEFLAQIPALAQFRLTTWEKIDIPSTFLASALDLQHLVIDAWINDTLPANFLANTPRLEHLTLKASSVSKLPDSFLAASTNLKQLTLTFGNLPELPEDFLVNASMLEQLSLDISTIDALPANFLSYMPILRKLTLVFNTGRQDVSPGFLARTPLLEEMYMYGRMKTLPEDFLANAPNLRKLSLRVESLEEVRANLVKSLPNLSSLSLEIRELNPLPVGFLDDIPQVVHLTLRINGANHLSPSFLTYTPQLEKLVLNIPKVVSWSQDSLAHTPQLQTIVLSADLLQTLPPGFLADIPRLQNVDLFLPKVRDFPNNFLSYPPQLQHISVNAENLGSLPEGFLVNTPELVNLKFGTFVSTHDFGRGGGFFRPGFEYQSDPSRWIFYVNGPISYTVPSGFLKYTPKLKSLRFAGKMTQLPADFLAYTPQLTSLLLLAPHLTQLPEGFLSLAPQLEFLELVTHVLNLPDDFLTDVPKLETLRLSLGNLGETSGNFLVRTPELNSIFLVLHGHSAISPGFLSDSANLRNLFLYADNLEDLPEGFLSQTHQLGLVDLHLPALRSWPKNMLANVPMLHTLYLTVAELEVLPEPFLHRAPELHDLTILGSELHSVPNHVWGHLWDHGRFVQVAATRANVRNGPGLDHDIWSTVSAGYLFVVWRRVNDPDAGTWFEVTSGHEGGWIHGALVKPATIGKAEPPNEKPQ